MSKYIISIISNISVEAESEDGARREYEAYAESVAWEKTKTLAEKVVMNSTIIKVGRLKKSWA